MRDPQLSQEGHTDGTHCPELCNDLNEQLKRQTGGLGKGAPGDYSETLDMSSSGVDSLGSGRRLVVSEICFSTIFCVSPHPGSQSMSSVPTLAVGWP